MNSDHRYGYSRHWLRSVVEGMRMQLAKSRRLIRELGKVTEMVDKGQKPKWSHFLK